jgi:hypothetical protein
MDFQYYEHDLTQMQRVLRESFQFTKAFEARTGFAPEPNRPVLGGAFTSL